MGLVCAKAYGIFPDQGSNHVSYVGRRILYHRATREAPDVEILNHFQVI